MPPPQQHPRDIIRNALETRQEADNPIKGYHICIMMLSLIAAIVTLVYEIEVIMTKQDGQNSLNKWINTNRDSSVRYFNDINDIKGYHYYDYIIIGAGTAGSVLATKLATHNTYPQVLLIESQSIDSILQNKRNKITSFKYIDKTDELPIESNINHNVWIRSSSKTHHNNIWSIGSPSDYDKLWNITNFNWNDILQYFKQSEKVVIPEIVHDFGTKSLKRKQKRPKSRANTLMEKIFGILPIGPDRDYFSDAQFDYGDMDITNNRGTDGKVIIKQARKYSIVNAFIVNALNANYTYNVDHNTAYNYNENTANALVNTVNYQQYNKYGIFESYIGKLRNNKRLSLDVLFDTQVTKILFHKVQKSNGKHIAVGVEMMNNSTKHEIYLRDNYEFESEIIVSAGAIDSPKLLMLSGFGDKEYLKECCDIDVIEHNKDIGKNLQDQVKFCIYFVHNPEFKVISKYEITKWKYNLFSGTMLNSSGYDANMYYNPYGSDEPLLQFVLYNGIKPIDIYNIDNDKCINTEIINGVTIEVILLHPKSEGEIKIHSDDPFEDATINPKYLSDEQNDDLELLLKGYREIENVFFGKEPFDGVVTFGHFWPCNDSVNNDDETIKQYIINNIQTNHNHIGTNKMGTVVDTTFVLNNTLNVRVVDGSIIPSLISGSIQAPIVMMAERASDIILEKRSDQKEMRNDFPNDADVDDTPKHSEL